MRFAASDVSAPLFIGATAQTARLIFMYMLPWALVLLLAFIGIGSLLLAGNIFKVVMGASLLHSAALLLWFLLGSVAPQTEGVAWALLILGSASVTLLLHFAFSLSGRYRTMDIREMKGRER